MDTHSIKIQDSGYTHQGKEPAILLKGKWLYNAGFHPGDRVIIRQVNDKLIIEIDYTQKDTSK